MSYDVVTIILLMLKKISAASLFDELEINDFIPRD